MLVFVNGFLFLRGPRTVQYPFLLDMVGNLYRTSRPAVPCTILAGCYHGDSIGLLLSVGVCGPCLPREGPVAIGFLDTADLLCPDAALCPVLQYFDPLCPCGLCWDPAIFY